MEVIKMLSGDNFLPVNVWFENERIFFKFQYHEAYFPLMGEIKSLDGRKWDPDKKHWSAPLTQRNKTALCYLVKGAPDPFTHYDKEIQQFKTRENLWPHQKDMVNFILTRKRCLIAADTGTGKSLAILEAMNLSDIPESRIWYVSTVSSLVSFDEQIRVWEYGIHPDKMTFEGLTKRVKNWTTDSKLPIMLVGDESSRLKSPMANRSQAFKYIADAMRDKIGDDCFVILATGTPAPNTPTDFWMQCEIACPAYLREGNVNELQRTLAWLDFIDTDHGAKVPKVISWKDDERKCNHCGKYREDCHRPDCEYIPSTNEIARLYKRMSGLVMVVDKTKVLDYLPDKHYRIIHCEPTREMEENARLAADIEDSPIELLNKLRCLSDGFFYRKEQTDKLIECPACKGKGETDIIPDEVAEYIPIFEDYDYTEPKTCLLCEGEGKVFKEVRVFEPLDAPKLEVLDDLLDEYQDVGRVIIYASYHASIDRIKEQVLKNKWTAFVVDGRGWRGITPSGDKIKKDQLLGLFQDKSRKIENIAWIGHAKTSGTGLTLTESPVAIFYSNSFAGEDRFQAEDRIHRPGMDLNKGATIIDIQCLDTDNLILEALKKKEKLQNMALNKIKETVT